MKAEEKKYRIAMTESQLRLMANAVEDWSRFLAGQCEMSFATGMLENYHDAKESLKKYVRPFVVPELGRGASWNWDGCGCPNERQRKAIAMSYMIYRQVVHYLTTHNGKDMSWSCYNSPTLTCEEQGPLIQIEEITLKHEQCTSTSSV